MCGRFEIHSALDIIAKLFGIDITGFEFLPSYNITPGQDILLIVQNGNRRLVKGRWGFIPPWAKDPATGYKMINAKAETLGEKPSYRQAFETQRCLVIADGFYEWKKEGTKKRPYYIRLRSGQPFGFAGLYNVWTSPEGKRICTSTIVTTDANELVRPVHERMPVIVLPDRCDAWLGGNDANTLASVLKPYPADKMEMYPVTPKMNSFTYDAPENIVPLTGDS